MSEKERILEELRDVFKRWEALLADSSEGQILTGQSPSGWSIKDEIAHLWGWQQRTLARSEAALYNREPDYPNWPESFGPDPEEDVDRTNAWIYEIGRDRLWPAVYADWKAQFLRILELSEAIPEVDLFDPQKYAWMEGYPLAASLQGTLEHHEEHLEELLKPRDVRGSQAGAP